LLGAARAREAHQVLVDLLSLPSDIVFGVYEDAVHENFPEALWKTSGGDVTSIKGLIENSNADGFCRTAAIRALLYGFAEDVLTRDEIVEYLQGLFTGEEASPPGDMIWNGAASALATLWPGESMDILSRALDEGLIDPDFIDLESVEKALADDKETLLQEYRRRASENLSENPHDTLSAWFKPMTFPPALASRLNQAVAPRPQARRSGPENAAKRKRKKARAARKRQRRKSKKR
jgi:hypothetical protein